MLPDKLQNHCIYNAPIIENRIHFIEEDGVQWGHQIMCVRFYKAAGLCATEYQTERHWKVISFPNNY